MTLSYLATKVGANVGQKSKIVKWKSCKIVAASSLNLLGASFMTIHKPRPPCLPKTFVDKKQPTILCPTTFQNHLLFSKNLSFASQYNLPELDSNSVLFKLFSCESCPNPLAIDFVFKSHVDKSPLRLQWQYLFLPQREPFLICSLIFSLVWVKSFNYIPQMGVGTVVIKLPSPLPSFINNYLHGIFSS